ncbi:MAG: amino acid permease [Thermoplasmata archaeon]
MAETVGAGPASVPTSVGLAESGSRTHGAFSPGGAARTAGLQRKIRTRNAVALYVSSVLGPGILILPGLAARTAGPASLLAWALLGVASLAFAITFASLSARRPEAGGVYAFAKEAFGRTVATTTGWLFALWVCVGAPAVALIAAAYVGYAFSLPRPVAYLVGFLVLAAAFVVNLRGIVASSRVQLAVIASIVALLATVLLVASVHVNPSGFHPFLPDGVLSVGTAAALIFWSYLGYENVSNVAEEFERPERDLRRAVWISVAVIGVLYFALAFVTVGTGAYRAGGGTAPFASILADSFSTYGAAVAAIFSLAIVFATVNAYTTGMSRVFFATSRDGGFPRALAHLHPRTSAPDRALAVMFCAGGLTLLYYYLENITLTTALLVAGGAALAVYIIGSASGLRIRLHAGRPERGLAVLAAVSLAIALVILPFVGLPLIASGVVIALAVTYSLLTQRRPDPRSPT